MVMGMEDMVMALGVTYSPMIPSPLVAAWMSVPFS